MGIIFDSFEACFKLPENFQLSFPVSRFPHFSIAAFGMNDSDGPEVNFHGKLLAITA
jgi:hypothetical protein